MGKEPWSGARRSPGNSHVDCRARASSVETEPLVARGLQSRPCWSLALGAVGREDSRRQGAFSSWAALSPIPVQRAFDALCHSTHLYSQRMLLEWADSQVTLQALRWKMAEHFYDRYGQGAGLLGSRRGWVPRRANLSWAATLLSLCWDAGHLWACAHCRCLRSWAR